jgi:hypothetical protein
MSELKAGDTAEFKVGDKALTVEAMPMGRVKKVFKLIMEVSAGAAKGEAGFIPQVMDEYLYKLLPLLFDPKKYPFLVQEWVEENMTIPQLREIFKAAVTINGLEDFFGKAFGGTLTTKTDTPPTPGPTPLIP